MVLPARPDDSWITGFGLALADQDANEDPDRGDLDNLMEYVLVGRDDGGSRDRH